MAAKPTAVWFDRELATLNDQAHERLEEFAFYVAEDVDWLNDYTRSVLERQQTSLFQIVKTPGKKKALGQRTPFKELTNVQKSVEKGIPVGKDIFTSTKTSGNLFRSPKKKAVAATPVHTPLPALQDEEDEASMEIISSDSEAEGMPPVIAASVHIKQDIVTPALTRIEPAVSMSPAPTPIEPIQAQPAPQDYLEPVRLASPPKRAQQPPSPQPLASVTAILTQARSPRPSIAFATLPPRQPFAKKSLGHRSSPGRSSIMEPSRLAFKTPVAVREPENLAVDSVKAEPQATPQLFAPITLQQPPVAAALPAPTALPAAVAPAVEKPALKQERLSVLLQPAQRVPREAPNASILQSRPVPPPPTQSTSIITNTHVVVPGGPATKPIRPRSTLSTASSTSQNDKIHHSPEDHVWLPRYAKTTTNALVAAKSAPADDTTAAQARPTVSEGAVLQLVPAQQARETAPGPARQRTPTRPSIDKSRNPSAATTATTMNTTTSAPADHALTPGPIRAAMQAASAKATSYLRQARTAFGSPALPEGGRFFQTTAVTTTAATTPQQPVPSQPAAHGGVAKLLFKTEPRTPSLYPDLLGATAAASHTTATAANPMTLQGTARQGLPEAERKSLLQPSRSLRPSPARGQAAAAAAIVAAPVRTTATAPGSPRRPSPPRRVPSNETTGANRPAPYPGHISTTASGLRPPSPRKQGTLLPKPVPSMASSLSTAAAATSAAPKPKPVSVIRIKTASQREAELYKERKKEAAAAAAAAAATTAMQVASGMNETKLAPIVGGSSSSANTVDRSGMANKMPVTKPGANRQIKALAAATQAKERAQRDQERREVQKRELERKRLQRLEQLATTGAGSTQDRKWQQQQAEEAEARKRRAAAGEVSRVPSMKKVVRPGVPVAGNHAHKGSLAMEDVQMHMAGSSTAHAHAARQSVKRTLGDLDERGATGLMAGEAKRRCTNETQQQTTAGLGGGLDSKPVRVSLQKKSMHAFGQPGEPGYKKPGVYKPAGPLETVKFSSEPVRFAQAEAAASAYASATAPTTTATPAMPPSELIELPDIHSEYSDSEDEGPTTMKDGFTLPGWAESPELRKLLRRQQRIDPDAVFGPVQPLQMEEIFKGRERALGRVRPRSSSANWSTTGDQLTQEEVNDYAKVMGYKN